MSRRMQTAQVKAHAPVASVAVRTSMVAGSNHKTEDAAPPMKASMIRTIRMEPL